MPCPKPGEYLPIDFSVTLVNVDPFLERSALVPAYRNPTPRISTTDWKLHERTLEKPLPLPPLQYPLTGDPIPDAGQTLDWPHPNL